MGIDIALQASNDQCGGGYAPGGYSAEALSYVCDPFVEAVYAITPDNVPFLSALGVTRVTLTGTNAFPACTPCLMDCPGCAVPRVDMWATVTGNDYCSGFWMRAGGSGGGYGSWAGDCVQWSETTSIRWWIGCSPLGIRAFFWLTVYPGDNPCATGFYGDNLCDSQARRLTATSTCDPFTVTVTEGQVGCPMFAGMTLTMSTPDNPGSTPICQGFVVQSCNVGPLPNCPIEAYDLNGNLLASGITGPQGQGVTLFWDSTTDYIVHALASQVSDRLQDVVEQLSVNTRHSGVLYALPADGYHCGGCLIPLPETLNLSTKVAGGGLNLTLTWNPQLSFSGVQFPYGGWVTEEVGVDVGPSVVPDWACGVLQYWSMPPGTVYPVDYCAGASNVGLRFSLTQTGQLLMAFTVGNNWINGGVSSNYPCGYSLVNWDCGFCTGNSCCGDKDANYMGWYYNPLGLYCHPAPVSFTCPPDSLDLYYTINPTADDINIGYPVANFYGMTWDPTNGFPTGIWDEFHITEGS